MDGLGNLEQTNGRVPVDHHQGLHRFKRAQELLELLSDIGQQQHGGQRHERHKLADGWAENHTSRKPDCRRGNLEPETLREEDE